MAFEEFGSWMSQARNHWKEFQPKRFKELVRTRTLQAELEEAAERTYQEMTALEDRGFNHYEAWDIVRQKYLFPPEEGKPPYDEGWIGPRPEPATVAELTRTSTRKA